MSGPRYVVLGLGAVGGTVAAALARAGTDVVGIARGEHLEAIRADGLRLRTPTLDERVPLAIVGHPDQIDWAPDDVVLLATKSQDTAAAIAELPTGARTIFCLQNGVSNEAFVAAAGHRSHGACVMLPAAYLRPGEVLCYGTPQLGAITVGRHPDGCEEVDEGVASALRKANFGSDAVADISRWKYAKLLDNLGNAIEALCGPTPGIGALMRATRDEGVATLATAGIDWGEGDATIVDRRRGVFELGTISEAPRQGGSTWQSLARGLPSVEVEYLNGEIVRLGRLHGVATPRNATLVRLMLDAVANRAAPASMPVEALAAALGVEVE